MLIRPKVKPNYPAPVKAEPKKEEVKKEKSKKSELDELLDK